MKAETAYPVNEWIAGRWSPYAFSERPVGHEALRSIFEAARWAPSSYNEQPWAFLVATRDEEPAFSKVLEVLVEANAAWARHAPVLALGLAHRNFSRNGRPNRHAWHDLGQAAANLSIEAASRGLGVHQMAGIVPEKAEALFKLPEDWEVATAFALGYPAVAAGEILERDAVRRPRKSLPEFVFGGAFGQAAGWL